MSEFHLNIGDAKTLVQVRQGALDEFGSTVSRIMDGPSPQRVLIVSDNRVAPLYARRVQDSLLLAGFDIQTHVFPSGEASKNQNVLAEVYTSLACARINRDDLVVAIGGGVVSDLAGFAAATWLRGIRWAICPTTLEADVDASIGGKTAVNLAEGKNLVGAFHQPMLVAVDPSCLQTLDRRDVRAGLAESIKHALICDESFLTWHESNVEKLLALDSSILGELIERNIRIKGKTIENDARERRGSRILLNFGHTIGHAIELCSDYRLRHGECVALGIIAACKLSRMLNMLADTDVQDRKSVV